VRELGVRSRSLVSLCAVGHFFACGLLGGSFFFGVPRFAGRRACFVRVFSWHGRRF
jgi:hypothetical protein